MADAWLCEFNTFVPATTIRILPGQDTYRGGALIVAAGDNVLDVSRDAPLTSLPAGWTAAGDFVEFDRRRGVTLRSVNNPATLTTANSDYVYFDAAVDVLPLTPPDTAPNNALIACLEHEAGGIITRVCLVRGAFSNPNTLLGIGEAFIGDSAAGVAPVGAGEVTLRLVRNGPRIYGFVGTRELTADGYTTITKILDAPAPSLGISTGPLRLATRTGTSARTTSALFRNFTVRSHASINERLFNNKYVPGRGQLVGNVPAATLDEVGFADVSIFGLFGQASSSDSFLYTLPAPRTVGNEIVRTLKTYQDPVIRD